jgi:hypothetical protein
MVSAERLWMDLPEIFPPRIRLRRTSTTLDVQITSTSGTKSLAIGTAQRETRSGEKPLLAEGGTEVQVAGPCIQTVDVGVIGLLVPLLGEDQMHLVPHVRRGVVQAAATWQLHVPFYRPVPVETPRSRIGQPALHMDRAVRHRIARLPDGIVTPQLSIDDRSLRFERPNVEGQHSAGK